MNQQIDDDLPEDANERGEVLATCDGRNKNLYYGDEYWGNNQIGTYCKGMRR